MAGKIERLGIEGTPSLDLIKRATVHGSYGELNKPFLLGLSGEGFDCIKYLSRDDLTTLRDWIDTALAETSELEAAE